MAENNPVNNITNNTNQALFGMNTDNTLSQVKPGTLTYALNAMAESFDGNMITYQNEQSNILASEFKTGFKVIAVHPIVEQNRTVLFLTNPSSRECEIGEISTNITCDVDNPSGLNKIKNNNYVNNGYNADDAICPVEGGEEILSFYEYYKKINAAKNTATFSCTTYRTIVSSPCLGFDVNHPVKKMVHRIVSAKDDSKCGTEIYWPQAGYPRRYMNLDQPPFREIITDCDRIVTGELDCSLLEVQPVIQLPVITPTVVTDGGSITAGTYQFGIQYANDKSEGYTQVFSITDGVGIFKKTYGLDYNFETDKSIKLSISNIDTKFSYFNLIVLKTINGVTTPELAGTFGITKNFTEVVYSGNNKTVVKLSIEDVFQRNPYYGEAKHVSVVDDTIIWAGVKGSKKINYQSVANNIKLKWQTYQVSADEAYANGIGSALYRGYMRDEVYALEFVPVIRHGEQKEGFHISSRVAVSGDLTLVDSSTNDDVIISELGSCVVENTKLPKWKVYNTGSLIGKDPAYTAASDKNCYTGPYEYGEFAYWESEKTYPCNPKIWGSLAGKPIRHHKFPDNIITHIHDDNPSANNRGYDHKIYPIGIRVDVDNIKKAILASDLSDEEKANIIGYKIIRSDRVNNKSVIAKGLLYNTGAYTPYVEGQPSTDKSVFYPNYPFNDLGEDPFLTNLSTVSDGGFDFYVIDSLRNNLNNLQQTVGSLSASLSVINAPQTYTDGASAVIISVTGSQVVSLQNNLSTLSNDIDSLMSNIDSIEDYYNNKISNGDIICSTDVNDLTITVALFNKIHTDVTAIQSSASMSSFQDTVNYIDANSNTLDDHAQATDIFRLNTDLKTILGYNTDMINADPPVTSAYSDYNAELTDLAEISCSSSTISSSSFSKTRFTFHSPDTHFFQPNLGSILKFETLEGGISFGNFVQVKNHAGYKLMSDGSAGIALAAGITVGALFAAKPVYHYHQAVGSGTSYYAPSVLFPFGEMADKALYWNQQFKEMIEKLLPMKNYAYQYNAVGIYNVHAPVPNNGFKQRAIDKAYYLSPGNQSLGDTNPINNWNRESSVYFRTDQNKSTPLYPNDASIRGSLKEDSSRVEYSSDSQIESDVLSYYASHKRKMNDQYGEMYSYNTVDTGFTGLIDITRDYSGITETVFGGDIFINRFGLKRKMSYFIDNAVGRPDGADISYSNLSNVGRVKYWFNTSSASTPKTGFKGLMSSILGVPQSHLDSNNKKFFYQDGRIYLYSYGIAYFFTESEVNVDFRQAGNSTDKDFYPNMGNGIPNDWLQESNVPIVHDNYYIYNKTYSKQNKENYFSHLPLSFDPDQKCTSNEDMPFRAIYSDPHKWRIYKPLSYFDFPENYGNLTSIDTINNSQVLVRFYNKSFIYNAMTAIQTTSGKYAYLGNDDVFKARPVDFGDTDLGYAGSQHSLFLKTEAGHLFIDSTRGSIFLIKGNNIDNIAEKGMFKWFGLNLGFEISKYFPEVNTDNAFNGVGLTGVWDSYYSRFIITKLDYAPRAMFRSDITCKDNIFYYRNREILITDPKYFCNKSWTLSYETKTQSWVSFHSYLPNYYIGTNSGFFSGKNNIFSNQKSSIWAHNLVHTSYQRFYGKLEPYILEYPFNFKFSDEILQNVQDYTTILEYYNENDFYEINDGVYFNKAILYNNQQCSGVLNLYPKPKGKMNLYFNYPKINKDSKDIIYTKSDNVFNYNTIWDVVKNPDNHFPIWVDSCESKSINKELNNDKFDYSHRSFQKTRLRAKELKIRHINDKQDRYKFISKFINAPTQKSYK